MALTVASPGVWVHRLSELPEGSKPKGRLLLRKGLFLLIALLWSEGIDAEQCIPERQDQSERVLKYFFSIKSVGKSIPLYYLRHNSESLS